MKRPLLLVHGWGYDAGFWDRLVPLLPGRRIHRVEGGHLGAEPVWPTVPDGGLVVGHSAGFPALLQRDLSGCAGMVAVNAFTRFRSGDGFAGVPDRVLLLMRQGLAADPDQTLRRFRTRCGDVSAPDLDARTTVAAGLRAGLDALRAVDQRRALQDAGLPVLALAARDDAIVTPAHTEACFPPSMIRWSQDGGHVLPLLRPEWCAAMIDAFAC